MSLKYFVRIKSAATFLSLAVLLTACGADYGFVEDQLNTKQGETPQGETPECDCGEPHANQPPTTTPTPTPSPSPTATPPAGGPNPPPPTPSPTPGPTRPPCVKPPQPRACAIKAIVQVRKLQIVSARGQKVEVAIQGHEVDLCALSKDFVGVLEQSLAPIWGSHKQFTRLDLILDDRTRGNRVETLEGVELCALRVPPGPQVGIRIEPVGKSAFQLSTPDRAIFDFDESDALRPLGFGDCQLKHPVGHYDLKTVQD